MGGQLLLRLFTSSQFLTSLSQRFALELDPVGLRQETIEIINRQRDQFGAPDAGSIEYFQQSAVADVARFFGWSGFNQTARLGWRQHIARQRARTFGEFQCRGWVVGQQAFRQQPLEELARRRQLVGLRAPALRRVAAAPSSHARAAPAAPGTPPSQGARARTGKGDFSFQMRGPVTRKEERLKENQRQTRVSFTDCLGNCAIAAPQCPTV